MSGKKVNTEKKKIWWNKRWNKWW